MGGALREEINMIERGDNLQWPFIEGTLVSEEHEKPANIIGQEKPPYFEYDRTVGSCVIGGAIYKGEVFPELNGKFLFADFTRDELMALSSTSSDVVPEREVLIGDIGGQMVEMPEKPGITGIFPQENGEILLTVMGQDAFAPGKIFKLKQKADVAEPYSKLSDLGVFTDLSTLSTVTGIIPYKVNAPLWSDRALKKRWMALPNDGTCNTPEEQIRFDVIDEWDFPEGTVFIKHFELPLTTDPDGATARLETRFFIMGKDGMGYGLTYKWNDEGTDAFLLGGSTSKDFEIFEDGELAFTQTWNYPSREQCLSCHNSNASYILGVKTHQMNGNLFYPSLGQTMNQLDFLNAHGMFRTPISNADNYPQGYAIDDESADLEMRIRSYLDSNCASCHRAGGVNMVSLDLRFMMPIHLQNMINVLTNSQASDMDNFIVEAGAHERSELWIRDASLSDNRMPPLARNLIDEVYIEALAEWIDNFEEDTTAFNGFTLFPNPTKGWIFLRIGDEWPRPLQLNIYAVSGKLLRQETTNDKIAQLDCTQFQKGVYILEIIHETKRAVRKFVVN